MRRSDGSGCIRPLSHLELTVAILCPLTWLQEITTYSQVSEYIGQGPVDLRTTRDAMSRRSCQGRQRR